MMRKGFPTRSSSKELIFIEIGAIYQIRIFRGLADRFSTTTTSVFGSLPSYGGGDGQGHYQIHSHSW
jgi:hypothetical protein